MATNPYTRVSVSGYNSTFPPDDGTTGTDNQISWAGIKTNLSDPVKTAAESIDQSVSNAFASNPIQLVSIKLDAGSASQTPLQLQSGTVNTTPVAGGIEFDGKTFYASFAASQRGVLPPVQLVVNATDVTLTNDNSLQSPFASANDTLTVAASTTYLFDALIYLTTGSTAHLVSFAFGGTATFTSLLYRAKAFDLNSYDYSDKTGQLISTTASRTQIIDATTNTEAVIEINGVLRINAAGTIIPQIGFDQAPGGTNLGKTNSFFRLYPVGSDTVASVGNWA